ncbi:MAG: MerR family transcriptional regulator [Cardiobacteriaceae bacterium]|nr:MerR family transcriptional regulator [Cardiobacteriaceae bacterium]
MKIQAFSKQTGLSVNTLRYYEKEGLLQPIRDNNGYRCYTERDTEWVAFIVRLKETNMPLVQIKNYARLRHMGDGTIVERYQILLEHQQYLAELQTQLAVHQEYLTNKLKIYQEMVDRK